MEQKPTCQTPHCPRSAGPRIIPVMDICGGVVVRAVGGRREEYRPLVSRLTDAMDPRIVARDLRAFLGVDDLYIADLDAIRGAPPDLALFTQLSRAGFRLMVDAGVRDGSAARRLIDAGVARVIAGLESVRDANDLMSVAAELRGDQMIVSVDLNRGRPLGPIGEPQQSAQGAIELGVRFTHSLIVLDLSCVGTGNGVATAELCAWARSTYPFLELIAGGGIRAPEDLPALAAAGVDAVLIASALHDGKFGLPGAAP